MSRMWILPLLGSTWEKIKNCSCSQRGAIENSNVNISTCIPTLAVTSLKTNIIFIHIFAIIFFYQRGYSKIFPTLLNPLIHLYPLHYSTDGFRLFFFFLTLVNSMTINQSPKLENLELPSTSLALQPLTICSQILYILYQICLFSPHYLSSVLQKPLLELFQWTSNLTSQLKSLFFNQLFLPTSNSHCFLSFLFFWIMKWIKKTSLHMMLVKFKSHSLHVKLFNLWNSVV